MNILIRMPNWLGDCVMALPAVRRVRESFPDARLLLAGRRPFAALLSAQGGVDGFVVAPDSGERNLALALIRGKRELAGAGLEGGVDIGILFPNSVSTAAWLWRVGAKRRIGYNLNARKPFLTDAVPCGEVERSLHFINYYLVLARVAERKRGETTALPSRRAGESGRWAAPRMEVGEAARGAAAGLLEAVGVGKGPYAVLAPASAYGSVKDWPVGHYRALAARLNVEAGLSVVVAGGAGQETVCGSVAAGQKAAVSLCGRTGLDEFAGLLAGATLFVGGDSGGAHVAAALGVSTVVIFGVTNPSRTRPTGERVAMVGGGEGRDVKLSSSGVRAAAKEALRAISPDEVFSAARALMMRGI